MLEKELWEKGFKYIGGVDEVGRGPLAGPLVSCCVIFPPGYVPLGITDSKLLSPSRRSYYFRLISEMALSLGVSIVGEKMIDCLGVQAANIYSFREALLRASVKGAPDFVIFDWLKIPGLDIPSIATSHAESKSYTVAAASIVAKVVRDSLMENQYQEFYPEYGFIHNKGYGTKLHRDKINQIGIANCHRRSFCGKYLEKNRTNW
ncbi:MAG: ribonuclease HII [Candidatus Atribacteria bacterium]|nr:ribonuclease HII [Candidatus Atribacteria bacterium]